MTSLSHISIPTSLTATLACCVRFTRSAYGRDCDVTRIFKIAVINRRVKKLNIFFSKWVSWHTGWVNSERSESYVFPVQDKNMIQTPLYMIFHSASPKNIFDYTGWGITQVRMSTFFFQMEHPIFCHIFLLAFKIGL